MKSAANQTASVSGEREKLRPDSPSREEKLAQLEKLLRTRLLHGSENLQAFLRYVGMKAIDHPEDDLKEYVIATEVFSRGDDFNPKIDSVVRVQAGRLRSKLLEYYAIEGKNDQVVIDLPKGHYTLIFSYAHRADAGGKGLVTNAPTAVTDQRFTAEAEDKAYSPNRIVPRAVSRSSFRGWLFLTAGLLALSAVLGVVAFNYRQETLRLRVLAAPSLAAETERQAVAPLWGRLFQASDPILIVYSNTVFQGMPEEGLKRLKSLPDSGIGPGSPALSPIVSVDGKNDKPVTEFYTGIGEVMGGSFLSGFLTRLRQPFRIKRSLLLTWDEARAVNLVVLGSTQENFFLRDLPQKQDFVFRPMKDNQNLNSVGIVNTAPRPGEQSLYLRKLDAPSPSKISEDYALVSSLQGLSEQHRVLILAGITTMGTQAAAEYVTRAEYIKDLIARLNLAAPGEPPRLPHHFQVVIKIKITGGVPDQVFYVTHHVLHP